MDYMGYTIIHTGYTQSTWGTNAVHRGEWNILGHSIFYIEPDSLHGAEMVYMGYR